MRWLRLFRRAPTSESGPLARQEPEFLDGANDADDAQTRLERAEPLTPLTPAEAQQEPEPALPETAGPDCLSPQALQAAAGSAAAPAPGGAALVSANAPLVDESPQAPSTARREEGRSFLEGSSDSAGGPLAPAAGMREPCDSCEPQAPRLGTGDASAPASANPGEGDFDPDAGRASSGNGAPGAAQEPGGRGPGPDQEDPDQEDQAAQPQGRLSRLRAALARRWPGFTLPTPVRLARGAVGPRPGATPIRVLIGYLPEVTERDATEYAMGIAQKHLEQLSLAAYDVFEYARGYAYEVHEGGAGRAYLPSIIEYFKSHGPYRTGEEVSVVLRTATRKVEVQRTRDGLAAIVLPESSEAQPTEWLAPTSALIPALNKRTGLLVGGAALFITGFLAMVVAALLARFQPYLDPPPAQAFEPRLQDLPAGQWERLTIIAGTPGSYVSALRFRNGRWEAPEVTQVAEPQAPPVPPAAGTPAAAAPPPPATP